MMREAKSVEETIELDEHLRRAEAAMAEWLTSLTPEDKEKEPVKKFLEDAYDKVSYSLREAQKFIRGLSVG